MPDSQKTYKVIVNGFEFFFSMAELAAIDLVRKPAGDFHLIAENVSLNAKLLETDAGGKKMRIEAGGETFNVEIKDELQQMLEKMGFGVASGKQIKEIKAPMPGLVLEISVTAGQEMKEGEKVLVLGAMKMENSILVHAAARIKKINVEVGQAVDKGQVLVELE